MNEAKHTAGPWDCWDMDEYGWHVFATQFGSAKVGQDCRLSVAAVRPGRSHAEPAQNYYEQVANARLIAAAPDMLEALQGILRRATARADDTDADRRRDLRHIAASASAAIDKATGGQP